MTESISFHEHDEEGTLVEIKGNIKFLDGRACLRVADLKEILRIYNGHYKGIKKGRRLKERPKTLNLGNVGTNPTAPTTNTQKWNLTTKELRAEAKEVCGINEPPTCIEGT